MKNQHRTSLDLPIFLILCVITSFLLLIPFSAFAVEPDQYEEDDTFHQAGTIIVDDKTPQQHNFHDAGDEDWSRFYGISGEVYTIRTINLESRCDIVLELYGNDGTTLIRGPKDDGTEGADEAIEWYCSRDDIYYIRVLQYDPGVFGENTGYDLKVSRPTATFHGDVMGIVTDASSQAPLRDVKIKTNGGGSALSLPTGDYIMHHLPGEFTLTAERSGYETFTWPVTIGELETVILYIAMNPINPILVDSDAPEVDVSFAPDQLVHLTCKAEQSRKVWVFLQFPSLYPDIEFARPSDEYCRQYDRYVFPFISETENLYYGQSCDSSRIDFGVNNFTGLGGLVVAIKKGDSPDALETIQIIRLMENK